MHSLSHSLSIYFVPGTTLETRNTNVKQRFWSSLNPHPQPLVLPIRTAYCTSLTFLERTFHMSLPPTRFSQGPNLLYFLAYLPAFFYIDLLIPEVGHSPSPKCAKHFAARI